MEENAIYKPFEYIEQYIPVEGSTVYANSEKSSEVRKNDCSQAMSGSLVTLTAGPNKFVSTVSLADANDQAQSWLNANAQSYANNIGNCVLRTTAWRGTDESCVLEPSTTLLPFEYLVIRYKWSLGAGRDLDTFTGFVSTGTEWDNKYMGYGHGEGRELPINSVASQSYIMYAGDNQKDNGVEACLINFSNMISQYPSLKSIPVRMAAAWWGQVGTGNIDMEITTYSGGTMQKIDSEYDFINVGGSQIQQLTFSKSIPYPPIWVNDIEQVNNIGFITFDKNTSTAKVAITY